MSKNELSHKMLTKHIKETLEMGYVFTGDVKKIIDKTEKAKSAEIQFWRRLAVRTFFDYIEALRLRLGFLANQIITLRGDQDKPCPKPKKKKNLRFFFEELAVVAQSTFEIKEDDKHFEDYYDTRKVRRHLTHPRKLENLHVSWDEYIKAREIYEWFDYCLKQINRQSSLFKKPRG